MKLIYKTLALLLIALLLFADNTMACDCNYNGSFVKMAKRTNAVFLVKINKYIPNNLDSSRPLSAEVEILEVYKGKEKRKKVILWGDNGILCRPYINQFKEGSCYVVAILTCKGGGLLQEKKDDYYISSCGCYSLNADVKESKVTGDIYSKDRTVRTETLAHLKKLMSR